MSSYSLENILNSTERHKLYVLECDAEQKSDFIYHFEKKALPVINVGYELAVFLEKLNDYSYLNIEVYDFILKLFESKKTRPKSEQNEILVLHNLGILFESDLEINASKILKELSKSVATIIIWEFESNLPDTLSWPTQKENYSLDFSDIKIKKMHYAI